MLAVQFSSMRVVEFPDVHTFDQRVGRFLILREAENCYFLGLLPGIMARSSQPMLPRHRFFAVEDHDVITAAALLFPDGCLLMTWASHEMINVLVDGLARTNAHITNIYAPAHVSWVLAQAWTERTGQRYELNRAERIYQLARVSYPLPSHGRLEVANSADHPLLTSWFEGFGREAEYEDRGLDKIRESLVASRTLFLWKDPEPVAMAAWVSPTPNGGCINFVYTPPEFRHRGYAKAVVSALGRLMLSSGRRFCFILTEPKDSQTNLLYQNVGARTLCELMRCNILPALAPQQANGQNGQAHPNIQAPPSGQMPQAPVPAPVTHSFTF